VQHQMSSWPAQIMTCCGLLQHYMQGLQLQDLAATA
jgi:hypothetical protein